MDNQGHHPSAVKKRSIDDIINNITSDLQSYEGRYMVLGNPRQSTDIMWQQVNNYANPQPQHNNIYNSEPINLTNNNPYILNTNQYTPYMQPQNSIPGYVNYDHQVYPQHHHPHHHLHHPHQQHSQLQQHPQQQHPQQQQQQQQQQRSPQQQHQQTSQQQQQMNYTFNQQSQFTSHHMSYQNNSYGLFDAPCNDALIENLVQSWSQTQNNSGVFSPFGNQAFQTSREMIPERDMNIHSHNSISNHNNIATPIRKVRKVAEVRPMRPSYSDVLAKSPAAGPVKKTVASTQVETFNEAKIISKVKTTVKKKKTSPKVGKGESGLRRQNSSASSEERNTPTVEYKEDKKSEVTINGNEKVWTSSEDLNGLEYYEADENAYRYCNILAPKSKENNKKDKTKAKLKTTPLSKNLGTINI